MYLFNFVGDRVVRDRRKMG